jgi:hypothetical protein
MPFHGLCYSLTYLAVLTLAYVAIAAGAFSQALLGHPLVRM